MGTSLELSAPPAIATACCPASSDSAALVIAWNDVAHARLTLKASMVFGIPVPSTISRAMFGALTDGTTCPKTTRPTSFGSRSARASSSAVTILPSSRADRSRYAVDCLAKGVRRPSTIAMRSAGARPLVPFPFPLLSACDCPTAFFAMVAP
jgi:hypothetical protein